MKSNPAEAMRARFAENMRAIAVGAQLAKRTGRGRPWLIVASKRRDTSVDLTLQRGRRQFLVSVPVCISGPVLWQVDLRAVAEAPTQSSLLSMGSEAAS